MNRAAGLLLCGVLLLAQAEPAWAGGYDTPILYSARHMGMGGAAVAYVDDPSALFHNPAGLGHTGFISLTGDFSPLLGEIQGSPLQNNQNVKSDLTIAPFFLVGGAFRVTDFLTLGIAAYPVASAGADYNYTISGKDVFDTTKLIFIEISPGLAFDIKSIGLRIGAGYRMSIVTLDRERTGRDDIKLDLAGTNFAGFRVGAQWQPIPELQIGVSYRHKTETDVTGDTATFLVPGFKDPKTTFTLPSKLSMGVRGDYWDLGLAVDVEYTFNSQNDTAKIHLEGNTEDDNPANPLTLLNNQTQDVPNPTHWTNAVTVRTGLEYRFLPGWAGRFGYIFDAKTSNEHYPTAFGTPAGDTSTITFGVGWKPMPFEINLAYAYRFGNATVTQADVTGQEPCPGCGKAGDYDIQMHGIYADFSWYFE